MNSTEGSKSTGVGGSQVPKTVISTEGTLVAHQTQVIYILWAPLCRLSDIYPQKRVPFGKGLASLMVIKLAESPT